MFKKNDIVRIKKEYLAPNEDANKDYIVRDCWDGKCEVVCDANNFLGYSIYTWSEDCFYKVGEAKID